MALARPTHARTKELGAFYTPPEMAAKLVDWSIRSRDDTVLDPSFGGFVFLEQAKERLVALGAEARAVGAQVCGIDLDDDALRVARDEEGLADCRLIHADFFGVKPGGAMRFTANIGNPPYVRYQSWNGSATKAHEVCASVGVTLTRLSSTWAPFILHGTRFLGEGGRLGQVLPAELLHSQYARPVIDYLVATFQSVSVAVFEERVFPGALEEVVLLFADGYQLGPARGVGVIACRNLADLSLEQIDGKGRGYLDPDIALLRVLPRDTQRLYRRLASAEGMGTLGGLARVDIGVVTGANDFFVRARADVRARSLGAAFFKTAISKATDVEGARLTRGDVRRLDARGRPTALLAVADATARLQPSIDELIAEGEKAGLHRRYKCRIRDPWYALPLPCHGAPPDAFLTYMNNAFPRLVLNEARALSTNTIHNVRLRNGTPASALTAGFYNSLTLLSAELVGRSYGGGILKLEPTEAERLLVPPVAADLGEQVAVVDELIRRGNVDAALDVVDSLVLKPFGLTASEIAGLRKAREKLFARRRARSRNRSVKSETNSQSGDRRTEAAR